MELLNMRKSKFSLNWFKSKLNTLFEVMLMSYIPMEYSERSLKKEPVTCFVVSVVLTYIQLETKRREVRIVEFTCEKVWKVCNLM